jgi:hypothetical protein
MLKQVNMKTIVTAIVFGVTASLGTYFLLPPPHSVSASVGGMDYYELKSDYDFKKAVRRIVEDCEVDADEISC